MNGVVIGLGFMGQTHLEAYSKMNSVKIVGVVDTHQQHAEKIAKRFGSEAFTSLKATYKKFDKVDFVDICLPSPFHRENAVYAMEQGSDVIIEKPMAVTLEDSEAIALKSKETKRRVMVAHVCRFMPQYEYLKKVVEDEILGKPLFFGAWRQSETPNWSKNNWLHDRDQSGGTIMDLSIHDIDIANWLLGKPEKYSYHEVSHPELSGCSHVVSGIQYENGAFASIEAGHLMPKGYPFLAGYRLVCEQGAVEWNTATGEAGSVSVFTNGTSQFVEMEPNGPVDSYYEELKHFVDRLESGKPFRVEIEDAMLAISTVHNLAY